MDRLAVGAALARAGAQFELSSPAFQFERYGWGTTEDSLSILALRPEVAGVVGQLGPGPHFSQVLAARLELPLVDAAPEGPAGETGAYGDWVFRCASYATTGQAALLEALLTARPRAHPRWAVLRTPGSATARRLDFWMRRARERGNPVATVLDWDPETSDPGPALENLRAAKIDALFTWSDARTSALLLRRLREAGLQAAFVGSGQIVSEEFAHLAPAAAGRVLAPAPCLHSMPPENANPESLYERSFAAAAHLLAAIDRAGPDRRAVRDTLRRMSAATVVEFDHGVWRALPRNEAPAN